VSCFTWRVERARDANTTGHSASPPRSTLHATTFHIVPSTSPAHANVSRLHGPRESSLPVRMVVSDGQVENDRVDPESDREFDSDCDPDADPDADSDADPDADSDADPDADANANANANANKKNTAARGRGLFFFFFFFAFAALRKSNAFPLLRLRKSGLSCARPRSGRRAGFAQDITTDNAWSERSWSARCGPWPP
jgi:hypothetical protein